MLSFSAVFFFAIGRVRSIINYDKTYGIFLRGFANICAVSNSVIYDRALLWWSTGTLVELTDASVADIDRNSNRLMPFRFFFSFSVPLLYFFVSFSAWRKSRTSCQPIALALGHSVLGDRKKSFENLWRSSILPKMIMKTSAERGSLEGLLLCRHLCDEMVVDEEPSKPARLVRSGCRGRTGKTQSLPKKGRLSSEKVDIWPQGKTFAGLLCNRARAKRKLTKNKK